MSMSIEERFCYSILIDKPINGLSLKMDWSKLLTTLTEQKVFLNSYNKLLHVIPDCHKVEYENKFLQLKNQRKKYLDELRKVANSFRHSNIRFILEKGIAFSHIIYNDFYLRETSDIDLLVNEKDIFKVDAVLRKIDYIPERNGTVFEYPVYKGYKPPNNVEVFDYVYDDGSFFMDIDIQRYIQCVYGQNIYDFYYNTSTIKVDDCDIEIFSYESNFIHLVTHTYVHSHVKTPPRVGKIKLRDYYDMKTFFNKYEKTLNWIEIQERVEKYKIKAIFYKTLMDLNEVFPDTIPNNILDRFNVINENIKWVESLCLYSWTSSILDMIFNPNENEAAEIIFKNSYSNNNANFKLPFDIKNSSIISNFVDEKYNQLRFQYKIKSDDKKFRIIYSFSDNFIEFLKSFQIVIKFLVKDDKNGIYEDKFIVSYDEGSLKLWNEKSIILTFIILEKVEITKLISIHGNELHFEIPYENISKGFIEKHCNKLCYEIYLLENVQNVLWMPIDEVGYIEHSPKVILL